MDKKRNKINRRNFLKTVGAAGLGSVLASNEVLGSEKPCAKAAKDESCYGPEKSEIPMRKLGKTGIDVPVFSLGMMFDAVDKQIVLRKAVQLGVYYWDTARNYSGGTSELGIGKFLTKYPEKRKDERSCSLLPKPPVPQV